MKVTNTKKTDMRGKGVSQAHKNMPKTQEEMWEILIENNIYTSTGYIKKRKEGFKDFLYDLQEHYNNYNFFWDMLAHHGLKGQHKIEGEEWVPLKPNFSDDIIPGYYVSSEGRVASVCPPRTGAKGLKNKKPDRRYFRILKGVKSPNGYLKYAIPRVQHNGEYKAYHLLGHRLVAASFKLEYKPKEISKKDWKNTPKSVKLWILDQMQINHKDRNRNNNKRDNLEVTTARENTIHSVNARKANNEAVN